MHLHSQRVVSRYLLNAVSLGLSFCCAGVCRAADLPEIVKRAGAVIQSDWAADENYAYVEKDETRKGDKVAVKVFQVVMIEGSEYHLPLAPDGQPLPSDREKAELLKLKQEIKRRYDESASERRHRMEAYKKQRDEDGALVLGFSTAFDFELLREETKNGHAAYVLSAEPKQGTTPTTLAGKVLRGMRGTVWIDKESFHTIHVECDAFKPVPVFGILASVLPGTRIELELTPVKDSIWLVSGVLMDLNLAKLHLFKSSEMTRTTYSEYRLNDAVVEELVARGGRQ